MSTRSFGYRQLPRRAQRTTCPHCGSKMGPASSDPADRRNVCHDRVCNDTQMARAGMGGLTVYGAARERGHCL